MSRTISFEVHGLPAAQGSKRHVGNGVMIESSKAVAPWRQDVVAAALEAIEAYGPHWEMFTTPVRLDVIFFFPRPKSHYGSGRNANTLKDTAPEWVAKKPDLDKTIRSTGDALTTAGIWRDDSLAASVRAHKKFAATPSALIEITEITK